ncbi:glycoside hydrolase family 6 protein [Nonomuraea dietziae]|uniref:glycoside hydrolase family 6 protein n=1 Tax=Nonomuraea dietziae TaxID=65515 RepID=UPI0034120F9E
MKRIALAAAVGLAAFLPALPSHAAVSCAVEYSTTDWSTGFTASVKITNLGDPVNGWQLGFAFPGNQKITNGWSATWQQSGANVTAAALDWNKALASGQSVSIGFNADHTGANAKPTAFTLNGTACTGGVSQPLAVSLTKPAAGATFTAPATVALEAEATGAVAKVEFFNGTTKLGEDTTAPYTATWSNVAAGAYQLTARATDTAGATKTSAATAISVTASGTPAISVSPGTVSVQEGGQSPVSVKLTSAPSADVTVTAARTGDADLSATPATLTFTPSNWDTAQSLTIRAAEDADQTNGSAEFGLTAPGHTAAKVSATEVDNDGAPPTGEHVANPYDGAKGYINPDYAEQVTDLADATGGALGTAMRKVAGYSTAVWMDRIGAITAGRGLRGHLDAALAQQSGSTPVAIQIVIYDLPNRDCSALASNGELSIANDGLNKYKTLYIDPIAAILRDPKYASLRIVTIIEPDSLPNLITNLSYPKCAEARSTGAYEQGVIYALDQLHAIRNVYTYIDIAHSGWLGWSSNFGPTVDLMTSVVNRTTAKFDSVDGFITNTANYTPTEEPYLPNPDLNVGGQPIKSAKYYEWNPYFDEVDYATALRSAFIAKGFSTDLGMLVDTSRNGWGGAGRPTAASTSTDLNTYVNGSRVDRRLHRGNWCNQSGAGIGARPTAAPAAGIDAYVWVKPPGESDGISEPTPGGPNEEGKQHDPMCDPEFTGSRNNAPTGALDNAPHAGGWFPAQFRMLVENAYPAL